MRDGRSWPPPGRFVDGEVVGNGISIDDELFAAESGLTGYGLDEDQLFRVQANGSWNGMPWTKDNFCRP
jgi:hypothetical protein